MSNLSLTEFLTAVHEHGIETTIVLINRAYHPKIVQAKAEKAARRGYIDYGTSPMYAWLTSKGKNYIA